RSETRRAGLRVIREAVDHRMNTAWVEDQGGEIRTEERGSRVVGIGPFTVMIYHSKAVPKS
ncbi:MAG: hypothetical protein O3A57_02105, partial [Bacteroidetes bacterium]|nr:hypothetical protein [Bacteroidota bacterium]